MNTSRQFGNIRSLAIHCTYSRDDNEPANRWMGNVWLTVMGITVGNRVSSGVEHIGIAISALSDLGSRTGTRANSQLQNLDPRSALNMVMSAVYDDYYLGVDDDRAEEAHGWLSMLVRTNER